MKRSLLLCVMVGFAVLAAAPALRAQPTWTMAAPLPTAIGEIEAATVQGKIYVMSGLDTAPGPATHTPTGYNWQYDPANNTWTARVALRLTTTLFGFLALCVFALRV